MNLSWSGKPRARSSSTRTPTGRACAWYCRTKRSATGNPPPDGRRHGSRRLLERKAHRRRRRSEKWYRAPRFENRTRPSNWLPPSVESVVSNQEHRVLRLAARCGAAVTVVQTARSGARTGRLVRHKHVPDRVEQVVTPDTDPGRVGKRHQNGPAHGPGRRNETAAQSAARPMAATGQIRKSAPTTVAGRRVGPRTSADDAKGALDGLNHRTDDAIRLPTEEQGSCRASPRADQRHNPGRHDRH